MGLLKAIAKPFKKVGKEIGRAVKKVAKVPEKVVREAGRVVKRVGKEAERIGGDVVDLHIGAAKLLQIDKAAAFVMQNAGVFGAAFGAPPQLAQAMGNVGGGLLKNVFDQGYGFSTPNYSVIGPYGPSIIERPPNTYQLSPKQSIAPHESGDNQKIILIGAGILMLALVARGSR